MLTLAYLTRRPPSESELWQFRHPSSSSASSVGGNGKRASVRERARTPLPQVCLCVEQRTIRFMTTTGINVSPPLLCTWWSLSAAKSISVGYSQKSPEKSIHYGEITTVTRITRYRNPADHSSELLISQEWEITPTARFSFAHSHPISSAIYVNLVAFVFK